MLEATQTLDHMVSYFNMFVCQGEGEVVQRGRGHLRVLLRAGGARCRGLHDRHRHHPRGHQGPLQN